MSVTSLNIAAQLISAAMLVVVATTWLQVYAMERSRRAYLWLGLEAALGLGYPLFMLGVRYGAFGVEQIWLMLGSLCGALTCGSEFLHAVFGLPRLSRWWWWAAAGVVTLHLALIPASQLMINVLGGAASGLFVFSSLLYQLMLLVRRKRKQPRDPISTYLLISITALMVLGGTDFPQWMGMVNLGVRLGCLGIVCYALGCSMVMAAQHVQSMRAADQLNDELQQRVRELERSQGEVSALNVELRRQIADRAGQLTSALRLVSSTTETTVADLRPGQVVQQRYRVEKPLGSGGMGTVYLARRLADDVDVALKVLRVVNAEALTRMAREAQMAALVSHPALVRILDVDVATDGYLFLVMEYVRGTTLSGHDWRAREPSWACAVLAEVCEGLAAMHAVGIVHRDLKPANILLGERDGELPQVKIADFGIALPHAGVSVGDCAPGSRPWAESPAPSGAPIDEAAQRSRRAQVAAIVAAAAHDTVATVELSVPATAELLGGATQSFDVTQTGVMPGTPLYMAPELLHGRSQISPPIDVYSIGVIAHLLLTGQRPFAESPVLQRQAGVSPAAPSLAIAWKTAPPGSAPLIAAIDRALAPHPEVRPTAAELAAVFRAASARLRSDDDDDSEHTQVSNLER